MITNLHIKNIGIIDDLEINLNNGMNVLTGETGAGKTLIIDSLEIICGGRFSKEMIRKGENYSYVEICMYEPQDINSIDGNIIITREIYSNGRNSCKINGRLVTVNELKTFMSNYIEIHGQNQNQQLFDNSTHIKYLDNFIGKEIIQLKSSYSEKYIRYNEIKRELKNNYGDEKEKQRKLDLLKYQLNEIKEAKLKNEEEEKLEEKRKIMMNSEKIAKNLGEAVDGTLGTGLHAGTAAGALALIDGGKVVCHGDGAAGADLFALFAADAAGGAGLFGNDALVLAAALDDGLHRDRHQGNEVVGAGSGADAAAGAI